MSHSRTAAHRGLPRRSMRASRWAVPAVARVAAGLTLAGIITAAAVPALAASLRSATARSATVPSRSATPKPLPRAFFGLGPASTTKIDGRSYFDWSATPGSHLTDHVAIVNSGVKPVTVRVFVTNAVSAPQGRMGFLAEGKARGGPTDWVTIAFPNNSPILHLAPRTTVILPITVVIPSNAPPGDHVGAVIVALTSTIVSKGHAKLHLVQQVADRIIARISGKLRPQLSVLDLRVSHSDPLSPFATGAATLSFTVKNTGNELLGGKVTASVNGLFGSTRTRPDAVTIPPMLPGGSYRARVPVTGIYPEFWMTATVTVAPTVVTGQYDQGLSLYSAQVSYWSIPWVLLIIAILLVAAAVGSLLLRRHRRRRPVAAPPAPVLAESVETVGEGS